VETTDHLAPRLQRRPSRRLLGAVLSLCVLAVVACGDASGSESASSAGTRASSDALGPADPATGPPVRIGLVNAEGGAALSLPDVRAGAEAAVAYANEHLGGLAGHQIELDVCNDLGDGASLPACSNELVGNDVVAVLEGLITSEGRNVIGTVTDAGIPWVGNVTTPGPLNADGVFAPIDSLLAMAGTEASWAVDHGYERTAFLSLDIPNIHSQIEGVFEPLAEANGFELTPFLIPPSAADVTPQVTAALATDPDSIFVASVESQCEAILAALQAAGSTTPLFLNDACGSRAIRSELPDAVEGATVYGDYFPEDRSEPTERFEAVMAQYSPDTSTTGFAVNGYSAVLSLVTAVNQAPPGGDLTPAAVATALTQAGDVPHPIIDGATVNCDGTAVPGYTAACSVTGRMATIRDGESTDIEVVDATSLFPR
jgi:branched-chain amino acid transport system substrate-binding protein